MLSFFRPTIRKSDIFNGFTDWHCHILPGVDDGVASILDAMAVLHTYGQLGVHEVWLTPHIMEDYPNTPENLRKRFDELCTEWTG